LGVALGERGGATWRIQHTASAKERLEEAGKAFARIAQSYETFGELANVMAVTRFTSKQMQTTIDGILPVPPDDRDHRRLLQEREKVQRLYETAVGVEKLRGTAWGAFQSWVEYADFHRALRDTGRQDPQRARLESIWMGRSAAMKQAALTAIAFHTGIQLAAA
jgi:phage/plasmid-like protein (TIGR03299 family)